MTYNFRLRFLVPEDNKLSCDQLEICLADGILDKPYTLKTDIHQPINKSSSLVILGSGYPTEESARKEGSLARSALLFASAGSRLGTDCGNDRPIGWIAKELREELEKVQNCTILNSVHGLMIYEDPGNVRFVAVQAKAEILRGWENFSKAFAAYCQKGHELSPREIVALELLNSFNFETTARAKLIIGMTSIEVLSDTAKRPEKFKLLVDELLAQVERLNCNDLEKNILRNGIAYLKNESIRNACRATVVRHLGNDAGIQFEELYKLRNEMVHHGRRPSNPDEAASNAYNLAWKLLQARIGLMHPAT